MIAITGANGFIGSALAWEFNSRGRSDLLFVDSVSRQRRPQPLATYRGEGFMTAQEFIAFLQSAEAQKRLEFVVHMGACSDTTEMDRLYLRQNNTFYTQRLFEWCTRNQIPFIYASSGATYGLGEHGFADTIDPHLLKPLNPYGESKLNFDRWVVGQKQTPPVWLGLRFFNVYGPNEYHKGAMSSVVFKAYGQILSSGKLKLFRSENPDFADGCQQRDFVYIKDITSWIWQLFSQALEGPMESGIFNMGFGQARSWLDLAKAVFTHLGQETQIEWIEMPASIRHQYQYFTEARIERLLALGVGSPQWSLETGVQDYVQNYLLKQNSYL